MSRTYLYRGNRAPRPLAAIVLASAWAGAALVTMLAGRPGQTGVAGLHGAAAGLQDRLAMALALGGVLVGIVVLARELAVGRTRQRGARLVGATVLATAGAFGSFDASRRSLRPGTPVLEAQTPVPVAPPPAPAEPPGDDRLAWIATGLGGALLVLAGGVTALRTTERAA